MGGNTFWLSQKRMAELFGVEVNTINYHLKEIFKNGELWEDRTIREFRIVQREGNREVQRDVDFYNLDAIISVGYRDNSKQATQFRIWATKLLREFIIKGFVLDDERLKQGNRFGKDYFDELAETHQPNQITGKRTNAVLISEDDWRSIQETLYLSSIPGIQESIIEGLQTPVDETDVEFDW